MFQALLCDDEPSVTEFLKISVPWESFGVRAVLTAKSGEEALSLLKESPVDLLITDIRMPGMDGLELIRRVREQCPETHCILLTAYDEFEYARTAIRLGVDNYILKPIQLDELNETVETTVENMFLHRKNEAILFRENVLRRWLLGSISEDELGERSSLLNDVNIYRSSYLVVCFRKTGDFSFPGLVEETVRLLPEDYDCMDVWDNEGNYVLILGSRGIHRDAVADALLRIVRRRHAIQTLRIGMGAVVAKSSDLSVSYQSALKALSDHSQKNCFTEASCAVLRVYKEEETPNETVSASLPPLDALSPIVRQAVEYIHTHYSDGVSIKEYCSNYAITDAYLGYLFKKETGVFFNQYLNAVRLQEAGRLLSGTRLKITEIAGKTGFASSSYFITTFKKKTGISPQKYREKFYEEKNAR